MKSWNLPPTLINLAGVVLGKPFYKYRQDKGFPVDDCSEQFLQDAVPLMTDDIKKLARRSLKSMKSRGERKLLELREKMADVDQALAMLEPGGLDAYKAERRETLMEAIDSL